MTIDTNRKRTIDFSRPAPTTGNNKKAERIDVAGYQTGADGIGQKNGGDEGDRTPGLRIANAALSQLSYIPTCRSV